MTHPLLLARLRTALVRVRPIKKGLVLRVLSSNKTVEQQWVWMAAAASAPRASPGRRPWPRPAEHGHRRSIGWRMQGGAEWGVAGWTAASVELRRGGVEGEPETTQWELRVMTGRECAEELSLGLGAAALTTEQSTTVVTDFQPRKRTRKHNCAADRQRASRDQMVVKNTKAASDSDPSTAKQRSAAHRLAVVTAPRPRPTCFGSLLGGRRSAREGTDGKFQ
ncbi:hypothetical protein B0H14DRAFT_2578370 [Mycena olivaceomarginata]|nr:hypothetical protein B0H14DRAFT_2578370 [Mycena olivaceomarginata]